MHRGCKPILDQGLDSDRMAPVVQRMLQGASSKSVLHLGVGLATDPPRTKRKNCRQSDTLPGGEARDIADVFGSSVLTRDEDLTYLESLQEALNDFEDGRGIRHHPSRKKHKHDMDSTRSFGFGPWPSAKQLALETGPSKRMHNHGINDAPWPVRGLLVRIVDETGPLRNYHLRKGLVGRADAATGECNINFQNDQVLHGVPYSSLETVVGKGCRRVEIVRGQHRGIQAPLIFRDPKQNQAIIRLGDIKEGLDVELSLDDVCEFA